MSETRSSALVRHWSERFRKDRLAAGVVLALRSRADEIWQYAFELLQRESPEYRNAVDDEFTKESKSHCNELLRTIVAIAAAQVKTSGGDPFDFVRIHASWRARHQVPLIASLHAYRLAHRTYSEITRDALLQHGRTEAVIRSLTLLSDFWLQLFDHVGAVLADAHAIEEGLIVIQGTPGYVGLLDDLLAGVEPQQAEPQRIAALCGIRPGAAMTIVVARPDQSRHGQYADIEVTLRSFARLIDHVLPQPAFGRIVHVRNGEVIAIVCGSAGAARSLLQALQRNGFGRHKSSAHPVHVGISPDVADIGELPRAHREARIALDFAGAARPVMHFSDIDLPEFLVRRADSAAFRLLPEWADQLRSARDGQSHELSRTIHAFAECNFNVKQTARRLRIHSNTVYFRLNRIKKLTGVDPRTFSGTSLLLTALRLQDIDGGRRQEM